MRTPLERQLAVAVIAAALLAALTASAAALWLFARQSATGADGSAVADALVQALGRGAPPQPLLDSFAAAGTIRAATVYGGAGETLASSGTPSRNVEQIIRSLPGGGSLSVEPARSATALHASTLLTAAAVAAACAIAVSLALAPWAMRTARRRIDVVRGGIDDAVRDPTYATRLPVETGALRSLTASLNELLDQTQQRDLMLRRRSTELEALNKDLESFAATVSHDLRAPLGSIAGFAQALDEDYGGQLDDVGRECIHWIRHSARQMSELIEGMLQMARLSRIEVRRTSVDITAMARDIAATLRQAHPERDVEFRIAEGIVASGDERLLRAVLENLIGNAFKFTSKRPQARIDVGATDDGGTVAFYVRDNGAGFAPEHAAKMFRPFQRLHSEKEFSGTGIGLATVHRIVQRHGGRVWAEGEPDKGATIYFTTSAPEERAA